MNATQDQYIRISREDADQLAIDLGVRAPWELGRHELLASILNKAANLAHDSSLSTRDIRGET